MIAEAGLILLWMAAAMALLQGFAAVAANARADLAQMIKPVAVAQGLFCGASMLALMWLFWVTDLSVLLVASNSHVDKPWIFKLAGTWGNHEGSMLLWVTTLSLASAAIALFEKRLDPATLRATLATQAVLALGFFAFLIFASNPFARLLPAAEQGAGLNPLLQDLGLAFHPPTLYIGYVGLSVAFSFAVAALITKQVGPQFARAMRPWVLGAWIFLTLGITAGSYWAYYELGWGGWWFWDPVENASLMPWLAATALLHSVSVLANRDALRAWTIMLALVAFAMSMMGTFLVRSGILTSVHSFAVDPRRGAFILALMLIYVGAAFALFAVRIGSVRQGKPFLLFSREGAIVANNVLLSVILAIVLVGTLYPILADAMGSKISVGPPYFNKVSAPIALVLMAILTFGPMLRWRRDDAVRLPKPLLIPVAVGCIVGIICALRYPAAGVFPILGLAIAAALCIAAFLPLWGRKLLRTPLPIYGMVLAHFGIAVSVIGMASESGFSSEALSSVRIGESRSVAGWNVNLRAVDPAAGQNWIAFEGELIATRGRQSFTLKPETRYFTNPVQQTNEAALLTRWDGQLYAVVAPSADNNFGQWQLRLWWKPFVSLIWIGGALIALGGLIALLGRMLPRRRKKAEADNPWKAI
jgi:cytochrome c-type biogenesis protein CcmF